MVIYTHRPTHIQYHTPPAPSSITHRPPNPVSRTAHPIQCHTPPAQSSVTHRPPNPVSRTAHPIQCHTPPTQSSVTHRPPNPVSRTAHSIQCHALPTQSSVTHRPCKGLHMYSSTQPIWQKMFRWSTHPQNTPPFSHTIMYNLASANPNTELPGANGWSANTHTLVSSVYVQLY